MKNKFLLIFFTLIAALCCATALAACEDIENDGHEHRYGKWKTDENFHWYECKVEGCGKITAKGAHTDDNEDGQCDICGYVVGKAITLGLEYTETSGGYSVTGKGTSTDTDIYIPSEHNGKPVVAISDCAFHYNKAITSLTIYENLKSIGKEAFDDCINLTRVDIGSKEISIGDYAFDGCISLEEIAIPDEVIYIGYKAFNDCAKLQLTEYDNAFYLGNTDNPFTALITPKDKNITSCSVNESTNLISSSAFSGCNKLANIALPDGVKFICDNAFANCNSLKSIAIPKSVTSISDYTFGCCTNLESVSLPDSLTSIGIYAFDECSSLAKITIPYGVKAIGERAFYRCDKLKTITIPGSVESIEKFSFGDCKNLTSVILENGVKSIKASSFRSCQSLVSVIIPQSVNYIEDYAFSDCWVTTKYCEHLSKPDGWSDDWCNAQNSVVWNYKNNEVASDGYIYKIINNIRYALKDNQAIVTRQPYDEMTELVIPSTVEYNGNTYKIISIEASAFYYSEKLTSVSITSNITSLGFGAFLNCPKLKDLTYSGTKQQWNEVEKNIWWKPRHTLTVHCTDGEIIDDNEYAPIPMD